ncbi:MAG TPA: ribonuclease E/G, partial [Candidatus Angelobacter sp.]
MAKELYVSSTPHETKVAVVEEDQLSEIYFERENEYTLAGSIYKGRVTRVLPGMQSAFVNIGLERDAFLYVSDFLMAEDEDADAIGEAVASSRNAPVIEVRSAEGQHGPIEAQEIMPPIVMGDEEEEQGTESAEAPPADNGAPQEQEREGARKWRGRRRRGRGGRDRFADRSANDQAAGDRSEREKPAEAAPEEHGESRPEPRHDRHESRPEPRHERHESRPESRYERPERHEGRSEHRFEQRPEPILLPGESISKYQPQGAQSAGAASQAPVKTESAPRPKPSTEYSIDPSAFAAGSMVLPGESLAKYGKERPTRSETQTARPETVVAEAQEHGFLQDAESAGPIPRQFEHEEKTEARVEAPSVFHRREPAPVIEEVEEIEAPEEPATVEETKRAVPEAEAERFENMNVASIFGGGAAEVEEPAEVEEDRAEAATHLDSALETPARESWSADAPSGDRGQQTRGVIEEEEIEEEESDIPGFEEDADMGEFEELEEEVLGQSGEQMVPMGSELMEAVRDAHVNERATGKYEAEGLDPEEMEEVEEAFGLAEDGAEGGEEDGAEGGEEESAEESVEELDGDSAEQRAPVAAGYQQRTDRRPQDRRGGRRRGPGGRPMRGRPRHQSARQMPAISDLLKEGQEILVQIAKEPIAKKGARITSHIALPGRYLVYMPTVHHTGVSRKIASEEERHRLKRIALSERGDAQGGFIVRTAAAGAEEQDLRNDIRFLINLWNEIKGRADTSKAPALIYHDLNLVERILRDQVSGSFSAIWADTEQEYERILR